MEKQQSGGFSSNINLRATVEILLHFSQFRNIDLFHQGIYQMKATVYQQHQNQKVYAIPYNSRNTEIAQRTKVHGTHSKYFRGSQIEDVAFYSKAFAIRFCEEIVELNDICIFRADFISAHPKLQDENFYLIVELLFADLAIQHSENLFKSSPEDGTKVVATFKSKLHQTCGNLHEFIPITFDEMHFSCLNTTVHTVLRDYSYKSIPEHHPIVVDEQNEEFNVKSARGSKQFGKQQSLKEEAQLYQGYQPQTFQEFLTKITHCFIRNELDDFYELYVKSLRLQHEKFMIYFMALIEDNVMDSKLVQVKKKEIQEKFSVPYQKLMEQKSVQQHRESQENGEKSGYLSEQLSEQEIINGLMLNSQFSDFFDLESEEDFKVVAREIQTEINNIAGCSFQLWYEFIEFFEKYITGITQKLEEEYNEKLVKRFKESIMVRDPYQINDLGDYAKRHAGREHEKRAKELRGSHSYITLSPMNVEDLSLVPKPQFHPIIYYDVYTKIQQALQKEMTVDYENNQLDEESKEGSMTITESTDIESNSANNPFSDKQESKSMIKKNTIEKCIDAQQLESSDVHVFIMVHGYQGNNFDMRLFKDNLALKYPNLQFLCSSANEDYTDGDIWDMGKRLAEETKKFINEWCPSGCSKLSFIGHSLGGLIIRAAIPHLEEFQDKFYTFLTLSSPHLGFLYHNSKMIDAGLWVLKTWTQCTSLKQLTLSDSKDLENTFIYKIAHTGGLNHFKNIVLVSSYQDSYVPYYSARIQNTPKRDKSDSTRSKKYAEILQGILGNVKTDKIHRVDVAFAIQDKNVDSMIGRAAHIQFLENMTLQKMISYNFPQFFE